MVSIYSQNYYVTYVTNEFTLYKFSICKILMLLMVLWNSRSNIQCIKALWYFKTVKKTIFAFKYYWWMKRFFKDRVISFWLQWKFKTSLYHYVLQIQRKTICRKVYDYVMKVLFWNWESETKTVLQLSYISDTNEFTIIFQVLCAKFSFIVNTFFCSWIVKIESENCMPLLTFMKWPGHNYSVTLFRHSVIPSSSVSIHYLSNGCTHSTQILHMDMSWENTGQVRIWSWYDDFWQSYTPFTLKIIWNFQFPFIISPTVQHIQLKLDQWLSS
jgi:hypothetical protein